MKKYFIVITTLLLAFSAQAKKEEPDAVYRLIRHGYTVNVDGSVDYNFRKELTILRNRALTAYADKGETFVVYNPAFETLTINECYTLRKDGSRVYPPKNAFVRQLPSNCEDCDRYNGLRELVIVHTGMEYGCTIVLDYTIHRKSGKISANLTLAEDCPIDRYEVLLKQPKGYGVAWSKHLPSLSKVKVSEETSDDCTSVKFVATKIPQKYEEFYLPSDNELYPFITLGNGRRDKWFVFDTTDKVPEAKETLALIFENDEIDYLNAVANYVAENVATNDISPEALDFAVSPASVTWLSNCGTLADKTQLLCALLREIGFEPQVTTEDGDFKVKVSVKGHEYKVSATTKNNIKATDAKLQKNMYLSAQLQWNGKELGNGYSQTTLVQRDMGFDARQLLSNRNAPLAIREAECNLPYVITLPHGSKLVTKPYDKRLEMKQADGSPLWSMHIRLEQRGDLLYATRIFKIYKNTTINGKTYQTFRKALIEWQKSATITLKNN
ncbi:MAG: DUF3857 domain-containing protein [Bacteroidales bacterium]|nr:DUF3857 domain-containing protein [Bacteroidales bacterium]